MDGAEITNKNKEKKGSRVAIILLIFLIAVPIVIVSLIYNSNKTFKNSVNNMLSKMPGIFGEHFRNYPTEIERDGKINYLSKYFLNLDPAISADKIYIVKKDDEKLYVDIIRSMNSISTSKTEEIVLKVRNMELRKDLLFSIHDDAQEDEKNQFLSEVSRIEKQDILISLLEVEKRFTDREFLKILNELKVDKIGEILFYTDYEIKDYILNTFKGNRRVLIEGYIFEKNNEENILIDIAKLYETKPIDSAILAIGNTDNYSMNKLGTIYKNLSVLKSAELLSNIKDEKFLEDLFSSIMREEVLTKSDINITKDINKTMEFLNEYSAKVKDLVVIYEKMSPGKIAKIVENMIKNTETITSFELNSEEIYKLSDSIIIIDVLSKMKNQTLSKVLDFMEPDVASQITRLLAKPKSGD